MYATKASQRSVPYWQEPALARPSGRGGVFHLSPKVFLAHRHPSIGNTREAPRLNSRTIIRGSSAIYQSLEVSGE